MLDIVEHYERAEWDKIDWDYLGPRNISPDTLSHIYLDALTWVTTTMETMGFNPR